MSGIPVEDLRKRKQDSKQALRAMREIERPKQGLSVFWWFLGAGLISVILVALTRISF